MKVETLISMREAALDALNYMMEEVVRGFEAYNLEQISLQLGDLIAMVIIG